MKIAFAQLLIIAAMVQGAASFASEHPELKAFPLAKEGLERFVIVLPHKERGEDDGFRIEIIVGKQMLTDGVNFAVWETPSSNVRWTGGGIPTT